MESVVLSVSDLLGLVNQTLEFAYPTVTVVGEVASFKVSRDKYVFFDLKDDTGLVSCFMTVYQLRTVIEDGMRVQIIAQPRLTGWGKFSLTVRDIQLVGEGHLKRSAQLLRAKLQAEGLFDATRKRSLPFMPQRIGLITSAESAAYADFIKILGQRWQGVEVLVANVQVQGLEAARQLTRAITFFNEQAQPVDVLVVIRGGGSIEDLAAFNEEPLVRAVAASRIPTVVGVGHETDTSLCDEAADVRAATPSNAAQLVVPDARAVLLGVEQHMNTLFTHFQHRVVIQTSSVKNHINHLTEQMRHRLQTLQQQTNTTAKLLRQLDPMKTLERGFAIVRDQEGKVVRRAVQQASAGSNVTIQLAHATITAGVIDVQE